MIGLLRFAIYVSQKNNKVLLNSLNANNTAINKSNAVIEFCPNGVIINANENFLKIMGYDISELKGKHHSIFVNNDESSKEAYHEFWRDLSNGKFKTGEFTRYKKDGSIAYIQGTYNPIIKDGKVERILKIVTDVTAGILQREELDKKNTYLEHAAKIIRHDMHSGINTYIPRGIRSLKRRLSTILDDKETETIKSPMRMLTEGLSHTQKVYRSVYAFTNLVKKDASLEKESCSIKDILVDFLASTSYKTQVHIDENLPKDLNVNKWLFCTAMDNLVRNGLKYNDSPTKKVSIYYLDGNIVVEDNGRGMTQTDFNQLSQPYARKEGQVEGGTGLGLNICVAILEVHGFNISVLEDGAHVGTKILIEPKVVGE
jgi:PAS domain S-box-containing protein